MSATTTSLSGHQESIDTFEEVKANDTIINGVQIVVQPKDLEVEDPLKDTRPSRTLTTFHLATSATPLPQDRFPLVFKDLSKEFPKDTTALLRRIDESAAKG